MHLFHSEIACPARPGLLQRCSPFIKAWLLLVLVVFVSTANNALLLWSVSLVLLFLLLISGIKIYRVAPLACLPLFSSYLFASYAGQNPGLTLARSAVGILSTFMFFLSTTIDDCLAVFTPFLSPELADGVYLTYRSIFLLGERVSEALQCLELRGLYRPTATISNLRVMSGVLGNILCDAMDSAERMGLVMTLRGVTGLLRPQHIPKALSRWDAVPLSLALVVILLTVAR